MKKYLTQLEHKIIQLTEIMSELAIPSAQIQAPTTVVAKLSPIFGEKDLPFSEEDD